MKISKQKLFEFIKNRLIKESIASNTDLTNLILCVKILKHENSNINFNKSFPIKNENEMSAAVLLDELKEKYPKLIQEFLFYIKNDNFKTNERQNVSLSKIFDNVVVDLFFNKSDAMKNLFKKNENDDYIPFADMLIALEVEPYETNYMLEDIEENIEKLSKNQNLHDKFILFTNIQNLQTYIENQYDDRINLFDNRTLQTMYDSSENITFDAEDFEKNYQECMKIINILYTFQSCITLLNDTDTHEVADKTISTISFDNGVKFKNCKDFFEVCLFKAYINSAENFKIDI